MEEEFVIPGRSRRNIEKTTNLHHFLVEVFYPVIDLQLQELNNRFNEINTVLLICVACLNPDDTFSAFNKEKLIRLAHFYPLEFSSTQLVALDNQLQTYILDVTSNAQFLEVNGIGDLAKQMVKGKKDILYPLVYKLLNLALILLLLQQLLRELFLL